MKLIETVTALIVPIVILCYPLPVGGQEQDPPSDKTESYQTAGKELSRCQEMENNKLLLHQQFKSSKVCEESEVGKGWADCSFKAKGTEILLVGAIGTTTESRMQGFRGSGFHILSVDPMAKVRTFIDEEFGTLIRVEGRDNLEESGCLYNKAFITLDAQVYGSGEFNEVKYGPVKLPTTEYEKTKALQKDLKMLGYYTGRIDGALGPQTLAAIEMYKRSKGMPKETTIEGVRKIMTVDTLLKSLDSQKRALEEFSSPVPPLKK